LDESYGTELPYVDVDEVKIELKPREIKTMILDIDRGSGLQGFTPAYAEKLKNVSIKVVNIEIERGINI
jgi:hypothetical protein